MLNENARKWVDALRSGKYKQGQGQLLDEEDRYCCLGVLCELYRQEVEPDKSFRDLEKLETFGYFPNIVAEWAGLNGTEEDCVWELVRNNDSGVPFSSIADIIESEPEGLFK